LRVREELPTQQLEEREGRCALPAVGERERERERERKERGLRERSHAAHCVRERE
jgi:hypothetical protein